jgi:hypothetical protein
VRGPAPSRHSTGPDVDMGMSYQKHATTVRPADVSAGEIADYLHELNRPKRRLTFERSEARRKAAAGLDCRVSALLTMLTPHWRSVNGLMAGLARCAAFRKPDGSQLAGPSLRVAILRTLREPVMARIVVVQVKPGKVERLVRLVADPDAGRRH